MLDPCSGSDNIPRKPLQSSAQARSCLGRGRFPVLHTHREGIPLSRTSRFRPALHPSGPRRGVDLKAPAVSHVPRTAARARVVGPLRRRPISRMRNTRWVRGLGLCLPRKQAFGASCERRPPPFWARPMRAAGSVRNATWLILPVVICLSQRLSHACSGNWNEYNLNPLNEDPLEGAGKIWCQHAQAPRVVREYLSGMVQLNSDGSSLGNPAAAAGIIRDADGQVRLAYQFALGTATSVVSELTAVWRGLELARAHSLAPIVVEVDATVVLQLLQSRASGIWEVQHLIMRIVQLQQELGSDVRHIFREANGAADHLAKDAASRQLTRVMYQEDITGVLRGIIRLDKMGTPYLRRWTLGWAGRSASGVHRSSRPFCRRCAPGLNWPGRASGAVTLKKLECSKQAYALYTLAWDNIIGFRSYYVGLRDRTFAKDVFINQERKLGARRRSDTVLVSTINDADQGSADVAFRTPPAPYEKSKSLGSGGSMVARLKLKGIDGRAPPGVEPAA
ncbi:UNVERIFIED_CONTAM: hypothetical protein Sindi_2644000 [Sesamum indicum]